MCEYEQVEKRPRVAVIRTSMRQKRRRIDDDAGRCGGVIKPNITFFGQDIGNSLTRAITKDKKECDCLIVMGTSLQVTAAPSNGHHVVLNGRICAAF